MCLGLQNAKESGIVTRKHLHLLGIDTPSRTEGNSAILRQFRHNNYPLQLCATGEELLSSIPKFPKGCFVNLPSETVAIGLDPLLDDPKRLDESSCFALIHIPEINYPPGTIRVRQ